MYIPFFSSVLARETMVASIIHIPIEDASIEITATQYILVYLAMGLK